MEWGGDLKSLVERPVGQAVKWPIIMTFDVEAKEFQPLSSDLPCQDARDLTYKNRCPLILSLL